MTTVSAPSGGCVVTLMDVVAERSSIFFQLLFDIRGYLPTSMGYENVYGVMLFQREAHVSTPPTLQPVQSRAISGRMGDLRRPISPPMCSDMGGGYQLSSVQPWWSSGSTWRVAWLMLY
jgi:hypothetical protein